MYTPLNIKTDNYLQTSMIKIPDLIKYALENNLASLTITDNNMYGVMDFYKACINNNIKPIIGLEITVSNLIVILYAKNYQGYQSLIKLSTIMSGQSLIIDDLVKYNKDLIAIVPYDSLNLYSSLNDVYEDIFIGYDDKNQINSLTGKFVYMNKILCLKKSDTKYLKYLEAIKEGITVNFIETDYSNNYLKLDIEDDLENNQKIVEMCDIKLPFNQKLMPSFFNDLNIDSYSYLKRKCIEGLKKRFGSKVSVKYQKRLKYELDIINTMGFCDYFLIVSDYVNYAKNNNIIVGCGRGSAVGSLVAYLLNITDVDPLKYDLIFERFLNPERISMPDIDIDFEHERREDVINYCINKYGRKKVVPIITFSTLGSKQCIRDIGKCLNIELKLVDNICRLIDSNQNLEDNYKSNAHLREYLNLRPQLLDMYKKAYHFEGLKRQTSIHAAGIIMSNTDLDEVIPLDKTHNFYTSAYDMTYLESIGLLKMDFLAIKNLTTIHHIIDNVKNNLGIDINLSEIPLNDKKTMDLFRRADTLGIFQFESSGMINFLKQLKPNDINDIFAAIALFRPGPMRNIPSYINRKEGKEKIDYLDKSLESILKSTYGIIIYQEQIMQIANVMADYSLGEADVLRKAMSKKNKQLLLSEEKKFISRGLAKGYSNNLLHNVYNLMLRFAEYGFNKSHSIGYSIVAFQMAYLKANYPEYFMVEVMNSEQSNSDKVKKYSYELKKIGIKILKPSINKSIDSYSVEENAIRYPLNKIKGINTSICNYIVSERENGLYTDIYDFIKRTYGKIVNNKVIKSLILAGAFDEFDLNRKTLNENIDVIINYGDLIKSLDDEFVFKPDIHMLGEYTKKEMMELELQYLGYYLTDTPVSLTRNKYPDAILLQDIYKYFDKQIKVVVLVDYVKEIITKKNEKMAFVTVSDESGVSDMTLFPKTYKEYRVEKNSIILVNGRVEKRFDKYKIVVSELLKLE